MTKSCKISYNSFCFTLCKSVTMQQFMKDCLGDRETFKLWNWKNLPCKINLVEVLQGHIVLTICNYSMDGLTVYFCRTRYVYFCNQLLKIHEKEKSGFFLCVVAEPYNILLFFTPIIAVNFFSVIKFLKKNLI